MTWWFGKHLSCAVFLYAVADGISWLTDSFLQNHGRLVAARLVA